MSDAHAIIEQLAKLLEIAGVAIILGGVVLASAIFVRAGLASHNGG